MKKQIFPEKELRALPQSQFPQFMCLWAIYIFPISICHDLSTLTRVFIMICLPRNSVGLHNDLLPCIGLHNDSTANIQYKKLGNKYTPRKGIARPQSQFPKCLVPVLCIPRNETARPRYFQNRIIMFCLSISTLMYLWAIYIFPRIDMPILLREICGPIQGIYLNRSQTHECGIWDWDPAIPKKGIHKWDFPCSAISNIHNVLIRKPNVIFLNGRRNLHTFVLQYIQNV